MLIKFLSQNLKGKRSFIRPRRTCGILELASGKWDEKMCGLDSYGLG
jgi:hypothetical protein